MELLLSSLYAAIFIFIIYKSSFFNVQGISKLALSGLFVLKIFCGVGLALVYTYYYNDRGTSDTFKYFDDANALFISFYDNPLDYLRILTGIDSDASHLKAYYETANHWFKAFNYDLYNDNRTVIRFNLLVRLFSFGYYHVHTVFMAFTSFVGLTAIYKAFASYFSKQKQLLLILSVYFLPSVLFWTSGVLKEGILMFAFGMMFFYFMQLITSEVKLKAVLWVLFSIFILMLSKFYVFIAAVPGLVYLLWVHKTNGEHNWVKLIVTHLVFFLLAVNSQYLTGGVYDFIEIMSHKQRDFINMITLLSPAESELAIPILEPTLVSLLENSPVAFLNTLVRPHIFEIYSPVVLLAAFENLLILVAILLGVFFFTKKEINKPLFYFSISFTVILFIVCGLTTPVMGALVRYKVPALPFLFIGLLFIIDIDKLMRLIKKLNIFKK